MAHDSTTIIKYLHDPLTQSKSVEFSRPGTDHIVTLIHAANVKYVRAIEERHNSNGDYEQYTNLTFYFGNRDTSVTGIAHSQRDKILRFLFGVEATFDENGVMVVNNSEADETPTELSLALDPEIYRTPYFGKSEKGEHYYEFHASTAKRTVRINLSEVDSTRFDNNSDDTNHFVVITKSRVQTRCLCSTQEQQGLEYAVRGVVKRKSALDLNLERALAEDAEASS